jgi:hypothetical protein
MYIHAEIQNLFKEAPAGKSCRRFLANGLRLEKSPPHPRKIVDNLPEYTKKS